MPKSIVGEVSSVKTRIASLDLLRGLAIFLMIIVNSLVVYAAIPWWLRHAAWDGYTISDVVAPMFLFSIGVAYNLSFNKRRIRDGTTKALFHFIIRYAVLFSFGFFGELVAYGRITWGVLAMIGAVGFYSLWFMFLKPWLRVIGAAIPFIGFQILVLLDVPVLTFIDNGLGGPLATPVWGFIVVLASSIGNWILKRHHKTVAIVLGTWGGALALLGVGLNFVIPFNKHLVTSSYILFSTGISALTMLCFYLLADIWRWRIPILPIIGRNALVLYILHAVLILGLNAILPVDAPLLYVCLGAVAVMAICIGVGLFLDWKKWYIRL